MLLYSQTPRQTQPFVFTALNMLNFMGKKKLLDRVCCFKCFANGRVFRCLISRKTLKVLEYIFKKK